MDETILFLSVITGAVITLIVYANITTGNDRTPRDINKDPLEW